MELLKEVISGKGPEANPFTRLQPYILALGLLQDQGQFQTAYQLSLEAIDLLPVVHNRSLNHHDQQYVVSLFSGLAPNACSIALQMREPLGTALEILERGRGVILGLLIDD